MATYIPQDSTGVLISDISKGTQTNVIRTSGPVKITNESFINVIPSGTFYSTIIGSGTLGVPISGVVTVTNLATAGSLNIQNTNSFISSGAVFVPSGNTFIVSGNNWAGVGSVYNAGGYMAGSVQVTNTVLQVSGPVKVTNESFINVIPSGTFYSTIAGSGTLGIPISGVVTVSNLATAGSLATQGVIGSVQLTTSYFPGSVYIVDANPIATGHNNPAWSFTYGSSGITTGMTGSSIGSIFQYIGVTTYTQKLTWQSGLIIAVGSWS